MARPYNTGTLAERFHARVDVNGPIPEHCPELGPCHIWMGYRNKDGYGVMGVGSKLDGTRGTEKAHRVAFFVTHGRWPEPQALHRCDGGAIGCVRGDHLFEGDQRANMRDCADKGRIACSRKTACPQGHPYTDENTGVYRGLRYCKECKRVKALAWVRRKRGLAPDGSPLMVTPAGDPR